jgi:hypothetical protein
MCMCVGMCVRGGGYGREGGDLEIHDMAWVEQGSKDGGVRAFIHMRVYVCATRSLYIYIYIICKYNIYKRART